MDTHIKAFTSPVPQANGALLGSMTWVKRLPATLLAIRQPTISYHYAGWPPYV